MNPNYYITSISSYLCSTILAPSARVSPYGDVRQALQSPLRPYEFSIIRSPFQHCCRLHRLLLNGPLTFREAIAIKIKNPNRPEGRRERLRARNISQVCICVLFKSEKKKKPRYPQSLRLFCPRWNPLTQNKKTARALADKNGRTYASVPTCLGELSRTRTLVNEQAM